jgi:hypothetical protein
MEEIITRRREASKTFDLGKGKKRLEAYQGPIHYKDHYDDPEEPWKDIDLTWEDNKILKAPYTLVHEGNQITVTNKRDGEVHLLELLGYPHLLWQRTRSRARAKLEGEFVEIIPGRSTVRYRRTIGSAEKPQITKYKIEGNLARVRFCGSSPDHPLEVETEKNGNIITERIKAPKESLRFPIRIDPTIDEYAVGASTDDIFWSDAPLHDYMRDWEHIGAGYYAFYPPGYDPASKTYCGSAMRFQDIDIEKDSIISSAYLTLRASATRVGLVRTSLYVENAAAPATYPATIADFFTRRANTMWLPPGFWPFWDFDTPWIKGQDYDSWDFFYQVQNIINGEDWVALNPISVFWDDQGHRTAADPTGIHRLAYSWDAANP